MSIYRVSDVIVAYPESETLPPIFFFSPRQNTTESDPQISLSDEKLLI